jgi:tetratricopeptide (TPR) repeat protein
MKKHTDDSILIEDYSIGGALTGQEIFPVIIVAVLSGIGSGFLSAMGKDLWESTKRKVLQRLSDLQKKKGVSLSPSKRKVSSIFFPVKHLGTTIIYYAHTENGSVDLGFDDELLQQAEAEIISLHEAGKFHDGYFGIDLGNLGKGGYLWPFKEVPSRENKGEYCVLADMESETKQKTQLSMHISAASWFSDLGKPDLAIRHARIASQIAPNELPPWLMLSRLYDKIDDADGMLDALRKASQVDRQDPSLHRLMAEVYAWKGDLDGVIDELESALELGFANYASILNEPNFRPFLKDSRVTTIIAKMKSLQHTDVDLNVF